MKRLLEESLDKYRSFTRGQDPAEALDVGIDKMVVDDFRALARLLTDLEMWLGFEINGDEFVVSMSSTRAKSTLDDVLAGSGVQKYMGSSATKTDRYKKTITYKIRPEYVKYFKRFDQAGFQSFEDIIVNRRFLRTKAVRESIGFERGKAPEKALDVGRNSSYAREQLFARLSRRVRFFFVGDSKEDEERKKRFLAGIYDIEKMVDRLEALGISIESVSGSFGVSIYVKAFEVIDSQHVIFYCASKEDAELLIEACQRLSFRNYNNFRIEEGRESLDLGSEELKRFLDGLEESRRKMKELL